MGKTNEELVEEMKRKGNLTSGRVEDAFLETPRELFVPENYRDRAYADRPLSIGEGQTISQPSVVAKMTQWLGPEKGDKILEVGAGSGWQAAILPHLVGSSGRVYTVERKEKLAEKAEKNMDKLDIDNVDVVVGDGSTGLEEHAPYDGIMCTAACPEVPEEWGKQMKEGGRTVAPVGRGFSQSMVVLEKGDGRIEMVKKERGYRFVPLKGEKGF